MKTLIAADPVEELVIVLRGIVFALEDIMVEVVSQKRLLRAFGRMEVGTLALIEKKLVMQTPRRSVF